MPEIVQPQRYSFRTFAMAERTHPPCPACGRPFLDTTLPYQGSALLKCTRKNNLTRRTCPGRAYVFGINPELLPNKVGVLHISPAEWREFETRPAAEVIRDIGALVDAVVHAHEPIRSDD